MCSKLKSTDGESPATWIEALAGQGLAPRVTASGHCWVRMGRWGRMRYPPNVLAPVEPAELKELFTPPRALVVSAHSTPVAGKAANAYLYLCRDHQYNLEKLSANNRSKVRRGLRRHDVRTITTAQMVTSGYRCVADTRERNGLKPLSEVKFQEKWRAQRCSTYREVWGALAGNELAAYLVLRRCGPWIELESTGSANAHLKNYPNHALFATVLKTLLSSALIESVSYGTSSLQLDTRAETLHTFKLSIGFEAIPIVRQVVINPLLLPFVNRGTAASLRLLDRALPGRLTLRRLRALVEMLGEGSFTDMPGS